MNSENRKSQHAATPRSTIFAMVTTRASDAYTPFALNSFKEFTQLTSRDRFILIDNDGACGLERAAQLPAGGEIYSNSEPRGFAANMNYALVRARESCSDLVFLNNDLIFTAGWYEPLCALDDAILSPLSNRELTYETPNFRTQVVMGLADYLGHENDLSTIAAEHRKQIKGVLRVINVPFFAIRIPYSVFGKVGVADESFGHGGGEDYDYCLRAILAGVTVGYAQSSYILHFGGKSSYSGAETPAQQAAREAKFFARFKEKWGEQLFQLCLKENLGVLQDNPVCAECIKSGDYAAAVKLLCGSDLPEV